MIGKEQLVIDWRDFVRGMSSSNEMADGGFSPNTDCINLLTTPGVVYNAAAPVNRSTGATGQMIASCEDPSGNYQRIFLSSDANDDGQLYSATSNGTLTARGSEDTTQNYIQGRADMVAYQGEVYFTSNEYVGRYSSIGSSNTVNPQFFLFNSALVPHPALVYEDNIFYGDGNLLRRQTSAGGTPATILTLATGIIIVALGIDPGSGKMLISYVSQLNVSGTINTQSRVGFYDGLSNKLDRTVIIEEMITAFPTAEGVQYASYGPYLGYWNGSGVSFLRRFANIAYDNTELMYKHHFTSIGSTLYFIDNLQIIAHGHPYQGSPKVFYPAFRNRVNSNNFFHVANLGNNLLCFSMSTSLFYTVDVTSVSDSNTLSFDTNVYRFPRTIEITGFFIEYADAVGASVLPGTLLYLNKSVIGNSTAFLGLSSLTNTASSGIRETLPDVLGAASSRGRTFQFRFTQSDSAVNIGICRIIIYYNVVE
ncbi:MAG: hypothetical protein Q6360_13100 [Candidatus Brocadiales bacterium]|nr:hypothetical protein [Candidatus Brocadiales bacterium]